VLGKRKRREDGVRFGDLREARGGGRPAPHAGSARLDCGKGAAERTKSGGRAMRRDLHLRWSGEAENEVLEVPPQTHEHQAFPRPHPLPRTLQDLLAHRSWVCFSFLCSFFPFSQYLYITMLLFFFVVVLVRNLDN